MSYRIEFTVRDSAGHSLSDSYEMEPSAHDARDSYAIASDLGSQVTSVVDGWVWSWFAS